MKLRIWIALLAIYIIWGSTYLAIRYAVESIPPFLMAGTRFLIAGILLYTWRRLAGDPAPTARQWRSTAIIGLLLLLGGNGLVSWAEQTVPSGIAALLIGTIPLWMVLTESIRRGGVKPGLSAVIGLIIGFGGILVLIWPLLMGTSDHINPLGVVALLFAAFSWAVGSVYSKSAELPPSSLMTTAAEMLTGGLGLYFIGALLGEWKMLDFATITSRSWLGLAYLTVLGSLVGFVAYAWLLRHAPISLVATYAYVNPLVAILLGSLLAQELFSARILIAALIIIGSVVLINYSRQAKVGRPVAASAE
ncbi:MAG: drug/metabolite exporter YedA [Anaerolineales bacterium]|nr:drug/metabolite exporter YedA [Anaerolineales bacterium]